MPRLRNGRYLDLVIYSGRPSDGGSTLAGHVHCRYLRESNRRKVARLGGALLVNWGNTSTPVWLVAPKLAILNSPDSVKKAISKVYTYDKLKEAGVPTLEYTYDSGVAKEWMGEGKRILVRKDGLSGGRGVVIPDGPASSEFHLGSGVFAAKYFPKTHEYRVHVFKGRVIDITQKKRASPDGDGGSDRTVYQRVVRSLENGWIHAHDDIHLPNDSKSVIGNAAVAAVDALGLDFGAVDVLAKFGKKDPTTLKEIAVCEINTAPGLSNQATLDAYKAAIEKVYKDTAESRFIPRPVRKPRRKRVRKMVRVLITTRKGNKVYRDRERWVYE